LTVTGNRYCVVAKEVVGGRAEQAMTPVGGPAKPGHDALTPQAANWLAPFPVSVNAFYEPAGLISVAVRGVIPLLRDETCSAMKPAGLITTAIRFPA
jgi:hypothetical protein